MERSGAPSFHPSELALPTLADDRAVRFDDECVLIPDPPPRSHSMIPKLLSKSYSLPLWKRKDLSTSNSDAHQSRPSFHRRKESPSTFHDIDGSGLTPCLVHHQPGSPRNSHALTRRLSLPQPLPPDVVTIPLRPCCPNCFTVTERCLLEGDGWTEKFTRAARRRRSASVDQRPIPLLGSLRHDLSQAERSKLPLKSLTHDNPPASGSVVVDDEQNKEGQPDYSEVERETSALDVRALFGSAQSPTFFTEYPALEDVRETSRQSPRSDDVPDDLFLQPMLSRRQRLSPIPSTNASTDDLPLSSPDSRSAPDDVGALVNVPSFITIDEHRLASANIEGITLASPSSSPEIPFPMTPPSYSSTSPPQLSSSPDTGRHRSPFHLPRKTLFLRAGADILKGVNSLGGSPGVMGIQPC